MRGDDIVVDGGVRVASPFTFRRKTMKKNLVLKLKV